MMAALLVGAAMSSLGSSVAEGRAIENISRYCTACWRSAGIPAQAWEDCTQQVYCRLMERLPVENWPRMFQHESAERREFVRAIDTVKKRAQRSRKTVRLAAEPVDPRPDRGEEVEAIQRLLQASADCLSRRQQDIVRLSLSGYTVQEIASQLTLPPPRVSDEKYKAIGRLRAAMQS